MGWYPPLRECDMPNDTFNYLNSILLELAAEAAQASAYKQWDDKFTRESIRDIWMDGDAPLRRKRNQQVSIGELLALSHDELSSLGFQKWDKTLRLIPLWAYHYIADGETLIGINGKTVIKDAFNDDVDLDVRFGCIAYGFQKE